MGHFLLKEWIVPLGQRSRRRFECNSKTTKDFDKVLSDFEGINVPDAKLTYCVVKTKF